MTFRGFIFIGAAFSRDVFRALTESHEKLRLTYTSVDFQNHIRQSPHPTGTLYKHITISFLYGLGLMNNRLKNNYKLQIYIVFLILWYERCWKISGGKLYISKICEVFFVKCYMASWFQFSGTGLKEIKNNIFVKLMQDTKAYVHLFKFYVATIAALSSIQFKTKLRT